MSLASAPQPIASPPRVLIVDDAADDREMYALFLTTIGGCEVTQASSGREAMQAFSHEPPDVVVLDARLPDADGAEICRQVRETPESDRTAVLAVTALPLHSAEIERMISAGTDAVLLKPCAPETLLKEIRAVVARGAALRERGRLQGDRAVALRARSERLQQRAMEVYRTSRDLLRTAEHQTLSERAKANYLELPGLNLSVRQAQRLWGFDEATCHRVLEGLVADGFLTRDENGQFRRRDLQPFPTGGRSRPDDGGAGGN
jgi:two-component system, OmpR family, alkaline phosphatase synthesis response regulator PhoP